MVRAIGDERGSILAGVERARATWTDERLDDLARTMHDGFGRVDEDIRQVRTELFGLRTEMNTRFDALQRLLIQLSGATFVALIGIVATVLATS